MKEKLLNPILDINKLNNIYDIVHDLQQEYNNEKIYNLVQNNIKFICDIERLHRKMGIKMLNPYDFISLDNSYQCILNTIQLLIQYNLKILI